jgi:hypothetical protein
VLSRHAYLPLAGWRWIVGLLPAVLVYGASDNQQLRGFGIYYAVPFVAFLAIATALGSRTLARSILPIARAELAATALTLFSALSIGLGYSLRPWKAELGSVKEAVSALAAYDRVLVQGGLYPHAGYESRVQLLTSHELQAQEGQSAVILLSHRGSSYPLKRRQWRCLTSLPGLEGMPSGLIAVPVTGDAGDCVRSSIPDDDADR